MYIKIKNTSNSHVRFDVSDGGTRYLAPGEELESLRIDDEDFNYFQSLKVIGIVCEDLGIIDETDVPDGVYSKSQVSDLLEEKVDDTCIVTDLNIDCTDEQVPSAKAVYEALLNVSGGVPVDMYSKAQVDALLEDKVDDTEILVQEKITATVACGAVSAGEFIDVNTSLTDLARRLLVKDLAPSVTITSDLSNSTIYEKGATINPTLTVRVSKLQATDGDITKVQFTSSPTDANFNMTDDAPNVSTNAYTKTTSISSTVEYSVTATNSKNRTGNKKHKFTFVNPTWTGVLAEDYTADNVVEADIKGEGTKQLKDIAPIKSSGLTINFTADMEKIFIAYDASYGNLTSIKDVTNGFELITGFENITMPIQTVNGSTVDYKFYIATTRGRYNNMPVLFKW